MRRIAPRIRQGTVFALAAIGVIVPNSLSGQMWFFPDQIAFGVERGSDTYLAPSYGRRFGQEGSRTNSLGLSVAHTRRAFSLSGSIGRLNAGGETLLGAQVGLTAARTSSVELTIQGGIGWIDFAGDTISASSGTRVLGDITSLRFPVGLALRKAPRGGESLFIPWVMPLIDFRRTSQDSQSATSTAAGMAAGAWLGSEQGVGLHVAVEAIARDEYTAWLIGLGFYWTVDGIRAALR